ncbi:hypothetical protein B9Z55_023473 [Caenorhabditis nigoni]|uniref:Uncharacterized protein n=1 Tax=Caenorhabditis nigoni TaxID=1611254 RepID=A0A2G5SPU8_9PELO|nr:hypothetical protein B9Z55_023473 [Caenorhabditis nigoni]
MAWRAEEKVLCFFFPNQLVFLRQERHLRNAIKIEVQLLIVNSLHQFVTHIEAVTHLSGALFRIAADFLSVSFNDSRRGHG